MTKLLDYEIKMVYGDWKFASFNVILKNLHVSHVSFCLSITKLSVRKHNSMLFTCAVHQNDR